MTLVSTRTLAAAVIGALVATLVLGALVLFLRGDDNAPIQVLLPTPDQGEAMGARLSAETAQAVFKVYVSGAVRNPGVYAAKPDDRLSDALAAAGGATGDAKLDAVNLALRVRDQGHYHIPRAGELESGAPAPIPGRAQAPGATAAASCGGLMDLNAASASLLETLPSIGQVRAAAIVAFREQNGPFQSVAEVTKVSGISPSTYETIRELITVCEAR